MDVSSLLHRYPCCLLFEQMREPYHRTFLSVKRRFFDPQGISQSAVFGHSYFCFSCMARGQKLVEERNSWAVSKNVPKSTCHILKNEMSN